MGCNCCQCREENCCGQGHGCRCGAPAGFERRFFSKEERIAELEQYLQDLRREIQAVEEHLAELKAS